MKIIVRQDDGTEVDVTRAVQFTYDALHSSMDFGSGFLDTSELGAMIALSEAAGFEGWQEIIDNIWREERRTAWYATSPRERGDFPYTYSGQTAPPEARAAILGRLMKSFEEAEL